MIVDVLAVGFTDEDDGSGINKPAYIVNVAVGIVPDRSRHQPKNVGDPEIFFQGFINVFSDQSGIAHLNLRIKVTFLRGEQRAAPIDLDPASFDHKVFATALRIEQPLAKQPGPGLRHPAILLPILVLRPRIEMKMHNRRLRLWTLDFGLWTFLFDKNRPAISRPPTIGR